MAYKKIKAHKMSEAQLRQLWKQTYCCASLPIHTLDGVQVKFYEDMFDHAFYESDKWKEKDKSILSLNRCEKMLWIKEALEDATAALKQGWDKKTKSYSNNRRVALVKGNYVVIIMFVKRRIARFVTAYEIDVDDNLGKFKDGPDWAGHNDWL
ncbi:hypothetical protein H9Q13_06215 [Pontibacter sp. JH31]|uniref:Uncharacterized protein n=1 Tax=Pontibacter aquaedesilientis TaxID=2766980 RepID=A0ABR7XEN9_9BACT|nr:hypothetical protein [Pontibacter aquaedesilientis]MBD1396755.1 hypothetical protein [Pontibacter aquaedesilientis]